MKKVELLVGEETAAALADDRRREAVGRIVDRLVRPGAIDPLITLMESVAAQAAAQGLTDEEIDGELAAYNAEHRS